MAWCRSGKSFRSVVFTRTTGTAVGCKATFHDDVIKWKHFWLLLAICAVKSPVTGDFPSQRPVTQGFDVFFDLHLNKRFSKPSWGWRFETPSHPLWRHSNGVLDTPRETHKSSLPLCYLLSKTPNKRPMSKHPDSKVHGTNMGPIWGRQDPDGPHVGPMNFAIMGSSPGGKDHPLKTSRK